MRRLSVGDCLHERLPLAASQETNVIESFWDFLFLRYYAGFSLRQEPGTVGDVVAAMKVSDA